MAFKYDFYFLYENLSHRSFAGQLWAVISPCKTFLLILLDFLLAVLDLFR